MHLLQYTFLVESKDQFFFWLDQLFDVIYHPMVHLEHLNFLYIFSNKQFTQL